MMQGYCYIDNQGNITFDDANMALRFNQVIERSFNQVIEREMSKRCVRRSLTVYDEKDKIEEKLEEIISDLSKRYHEDRYNVVHVVQEVLNNLERDYE